MSHFTKIQGETSMKKLSLVLALMVVCSLAASAKDTYYDFTLRDTSGNPYCNIVYLRLYTPGAPVPKAVVAGYYYSPACDGTVVPASGFKHGQSAYLQYGSGAVLDASTPAYYKYTGVNTQVLVNPKGTWAIYQSSDYTNNYLINYGTFVNGTARQHAETKRDAAKR
jgi:hypothetical protein